MKKQREKELLISLYMVRSKKLSLERQGGYQNCEKWAIGWEILQAKLVFPSTLGLMCLEHTNKLVLVNNYQSFILVML